METRSLSHTGKIIAAFRNILDKAALFIYVFLLFFQVRRYYSDVDGVIYWGAYNTAIIALFIVAELKILINVRSNPKYSISAFAFVIFAIFCTIFKNDMQYYMVFDWHTNILNLTLLIVSMYGIRFTDIAWIFVIVRSFNSIVRIAAALLGLLPGTIGEAEFMGGVYDVPTYGFGSKNALFALWFWIALVWMYLASKSTKKIFHAIPIGFLSVIFSCISLSRTGIIVMAAAYILFLINAIEEKRALPKIFNSLMGLADKVMMLVPALCTIFSVLGLFAYNYFVSIGKIQRTGNLLQRFKQFSIDCALHGIRLPWANDQYTQITNGPFNWICGDSSLSRYCDNSIHNLLMNYGLIMLVLLVASLQIWAVRSYRRKDRTALVIISAICVYSMFESYATLWSHDVFMLLIFAKSIWDVEPSDVEPGDVENTKKYVGDIPVGLIIFLVFEAIAALLTVRTVYMQWWLLFFDIVAAAAYFVLGKSQHVE